MSGKSAIISFSSILFLKIHTQTTTKYGIFVM